MSVTIEQVEKISALAKLAFSEDEKVTFVEQFNQILQYIDKLNELDTENVVPTAHVLDLQNVTRPDELKEWLDQHDALKGAPKANAGHFSVPKVIG